MCKAVETYTERANSDEFSPCLTQQDGVWVTDGLGHSKVLDSGIKRWKHGAKSRIQVTTPRHEAELQNCG